MLHELRIYIPVLIKNTNRNKSENSFTMLQKEALNSTMSTTILKVLSQQATRPETEWASSNPVLLCGQLAFSSDKEGQFKIGDGVKAWSELAYNDANTVNGHTVHSDVPANAKFTDTVYAHPSFHPASMITEDGAHRFVTDEEKTEWNSIPGIYFDEMPDCAPAGSICFMTEDALLS